MKEIFLGAAFSLTILYRNLFFVLFFFLNTATGLKSCCSSMCWSIMACLVLLIVRSVGSFGMQILHYIRSQSQSQALFLHLSLSLSHAHAHARTHGEAISEHQPLVFKTSEHSTPGRILRRRDHAAHTRRIGATLSGVFSSGVLEL